MGAKKQILFEEIDFMTTSMVAKRVSKSTQTIRREIEAGRLPAKRFKKDYAITPEDFAIWKAQYFKDI